MPASTTERQVQWASANTQDVAATGTAESDTLVIPETEFAIKVQVMADNQFATPASVDRINITILQSLGDPDGGGVDEFETPAHADKSIRLDTHAEDPAIAVLTLDAPVKALKVHADATGSANTIRVSATVLTQAI